jgi:hypothetical protein
MMSKSTKFELLHGTRQVVPEYFFLRRVEGVDVRTRIERLTPKAVPGLRNPRTNIVLFNALAELSKPWSSVSVEREEVFWKGMNKSEREKYRTCRLDSRYMQVRPLASICAHSQP